ncbi:hypothetical protein P4H66_28175 [Paenibacillus dokdonensis]|uniref:Uncharacterized protein n=1 Tax=Paenibacillus dokdonensis TaxID=2567944 RepID=A0ABU6GVB0_9BACL|nr:hypothetical protein [Paenibacillus dokdonensis]MEC0243690.1 hypothetical protein [Paenibacillus dokdonensis]
MEDKYVIPMLSGERWWGGRAADGMSMPYGMDAFEADLIETLGMNQAAPLLLSSKGRYVWSEEPFAFSFSAEDLVISNGKSKVTVAEGFENLREAFRQAASRHFPARDIC